MTMNPIINSILLTTLGNYGPSYASNDNIPNPSIMILNPYYLANPSLTFSNIIRFVAYPFLNMVSIIITTMGGSQGVQTSMMTPLVNALIGAFFIENLVLYFQLPTRNSPSRFGNSKHGIPTGSNGSPLHKSGGPLGGGRRPLGGGGGPLGRRKPPSGGGPLSGKEPP